MKKLALLIIVFISLSASAQYEYSDECARAHELITSLRFDEARTLLEQEKSQNPGNLIPLMLENYIDFLMVITSEDEQIFDSLAEIRSARIKILHDGDKESPWHRSLLANSSLQWAFARVTFGSYFNAALDIRRSYMLLTENSEEYPGFLPDQVGLGLMHALIGSIPDNYRWIAGIFDMHGSVEQGREELLNVLEKANDHGYPFLEDEALFFISFIDINLQAEKDKSLQLLPYYDNKNDGNLLLVFSKSRILMQTGRNEEAIKLLSDRPAGDEYFPFYYLDYLLGLTKLNRLDNDVSKHFFRFTTNFGGNSYIKSAYQRLAWSSLLQGDTIGFYRYMEKVKLYGDDFTDGDKLALKDARSGEIPNICLLKARLLYDGGYYYSADSVLSRNDCKLISSRDTIEYTYRCGRIHHALGDKQKALYWYDKAIKAGSKYEWYFAANAAIQAGMICESSGDIDRAEFYFRESIRMKNTEYKTSLNQKAKAGLNRVEDKRKRKL